MQKNDLLSRASVAAGRRREGRVERMDVCTQDWDCQGPAIGESNFRTALYFPTEEEGGKILPRV